MYETPVAYSSYGENGVTPYGWFNTYQNVYQTEQAVWDSAVAAWQVVAAAAVGIAAAIVLYV